MWSNYWQVKSSTFYFLSTSPKMPRKVLNDQFSWPVRDIFVCLSRDDHIVVFWPSCWWHCSGNFFVAIEGRCDHSYSTLWKPLCDNPLIKLDLQDVFSSLQDEEDDDTIYNYEGAKGLLPILINIDSRTLMRFSFYISCSRSILFAAKKCQRIDCWNGIDNFLTCNR